MWGLSPELGRRILADAFPLASFDTSRIPPGLDGTLARMGTLEARLARKRKEVRKAQRLRFKVFFEEGGTVPDAKAMLTRRDTDAFDDICDHLIVIDHAARTRRGAIKPKVVGAYRLLRSDVARAEQGFYSAAEYDLAPFLRRHEGDNLLELGRSCVLKPYRSKRTIELLWRGVLAYIRAYDIDALIGCTSLEGPNPLAHSRALSYLAHFARAEGDWAVRAREDLYVPMQMLDKEAVCIRTALAELPPLIKGYLRVGAKFGDGAVVDRKFNTTDVFAIMPVADMDARYIEFFGGASTCDQRVA